MPIDPDAANWKYKIVNYDLETTDESSLLASQNDMEKDLNEWGEGGWQLVSLVHVQNMGNLKRLMATLKNSQFIGAIGSTPKSWDLPE